MAENTAPGAPIADQEEVKVQAGRARALAAADLPDKVHTWPYLVRAEFISGCILLLVLLVWSISTLFARRDTDTRIDALEILKRRYAAGEITTAEFETARKALAA